MCWGFGEELARKKITPVRMSAGDAQPMSKDRIWTTKVEPTSAPNMMARPADSESNPRPAKEFASRAVAVALCNTPATPVPTAKADSRVRVVRPISRRSSGP